MTMGEALPELTRELESALRTSGRDDLAAACAVLPIESVCACGEPTCASFYTGPRPGGPWPQPHENIIVNIASGLVVLVVIDVVQDRIRFVEALDRPDVRQKLSDLLS